MWLPATLVYSVGLLIAALVPFRWSALEQLPRVGATIGGDDSVRFGVQVAIVVLGYVLAVQGTWLLGNAADYLLESPASSGSARSGPFSRLIGDETTGRRLWPVLVATSALVVAYIILSWTRGVFDPPQALLATTTLISALYTRRPFSFVHQVVPGILSSGVSMARWSTARGTRPVRRPLAPPAPDQDVYSEEEPLDDAIQVSYPPDGEAPDPPTGAGPDDDGEDDDDGDLPSDEGPEEGEASDEP